MEKAVGKGIDNHVKNFLQATGLDNNMISELKKIFEILSDVIQITPTEGNGLILNLWKY